MQKISACLVVYNEEKVIRRCLDSLKGVVDEIILVHDGPCTDSTLRMAGKYTRKIYIRPHVGEPVPHRPFAISKATGDWILQIDADEYLSQGIRKNLRKLAQDKSVDVYAFLWEVISGTKVLRPVGFARSYRPCFYRKGSLIYKGDTFHEIPRIKGRRRNLELVLHHRPLYDNYSLAVFRKKWLGWAHSQAGLMIKNRKAGKPAIYYLFKAPLWFVLYFCYYFFYSLGFLHGLTGFRISFVHGLYNFYLNLYIFRLKL